MRWTLPIGLGLYERIRLTVAEAYDSMGTHPHQADVLADLATGLADQVISQARDSAFINVTASLGGGAATVSAVPSDTQEAGLSAPLYLHGPAAEELSTTTHHVAAGPLIMATVPIQVRRVFDRIPHRTVSHRYRTADPDAPDRAHINSALALGVWGARQSLAVHLGGEARALVAEAAAAGAAEVTVITATDGHRRASVHALTRVCTADHPAELIDPNTAAALDRAGTCPCVALALPGREWPVGHPFISCRPALPTP
ncbi:hypothetical protein [Streptomyces sp. NPDC094468]|uniref:hypothetical protein n=1 Tax=Streptomyces sp. NPDC094468 TaxID=3366066 RepID=UPI003807E965